MILMDSIRNDFNGPEFNLKKRHPNPVITNNQDAQTLDPYQPQSLTWQPNF
jgi:hypothetical protein